MDIHLKRPGRISDFEMGEVKTWLEPWFGRKEKCCSSSDNVLITYRQCTLASPDLYAFWPFDDASGDARELVAARSLTVTSNGGFPTYAATGPFVGVPTDTAILFGGAAGVFGAQDRMERTLTSGEFAAVFGSNHAWTVEMWIYPTVAQTGRLFEIWSGSSNDWLLINRVSTGEISVNRTTDTVVSAAASTPLNTWSHVRLSYSGTGANGLKLWINGVNVASATSSTAFTNAAMAIGNNRNTGGTGWSPFNGRIADVALYSAAVSAFCSTVTASGPGAGGTDAPEGYVYLSDGAGSATWEPQSELDHGSLGGLADDDHTQYHNNTRGDARYPLLSLVTTAGDILVATASSVLARLALGNTDEVLVVDTAASPKIKWQARIKTLCKNGSTALTGAVTLTGGSNVTLTQSGNDISIAASVVGSGAVDSFAKSGSSPLTGAVTVSASGGLSATQSGQDVAFAMVAPTALLYDYEVTGSDKASIDTNSDGAYAGAFSGAYTLLEIYVYARTDEATIPSTVNMTLNNDSGSNYDNQRITGANTTISGAGGNATAWANNLAGSSAAASFFGQMVVRIHNYAGTVGYKAADMSAGFQDTTGANDSYSVRGMTYRSTSAITRVAIAPATAAKKFKVGTRMTIYAR